MRSPPRSRRARRAAGARSTCASGMGSTSGSSPTAASTASAPGIAACRWRGCRASASAGRSPGACATTTGCAASAAGWWRRAGCATSGRRARATGSTARSRTSRRARCASSGSLDGDRVVVRASATVDEVSALGHRMELSRTWTTRTGEGRLELVDVTRNLGREAEPAPLLYHVNLGAPLWSPGATLALDARRTIPRDEDAIEPWDRALDVVPGARERVFEHEVRRAGRHRRLAADRAAPHPALGPSAPAPVGPSRAGDRGPRPRARQLQRPRARVRPGGGPAPRARAGRGARHAARDQRRGALTSSRYRSSSCAAS